VNGADLYSQPLFTDGSGRLAALGGLGRLGRKVGTATAATALALADDEERIGTLLDTILDLALAVRPDVVEGTLAENRKVLRLGVERLRHHRAEGRHRDGLAVVLVVDGLDRRSDLGRLRLQLRLALEGRRAEGRSGLVEVDLAVHLDERHRDIERSAHDL